MTIDDQPDETAPGVLSTGLAPDQPDRPGPSRRRIRHEIAAGDTLGDYRIERRLGAGGMGEVFAALDTRSDDRVALKVLGQAGSTALYRFKREFRALADVEHPNLIALRELVVPEDGVPFFTMELVDGVSFTEYVRGRVPAGSLPNLVRLGRALGQLVVGVHQLHLVQCLHRDLKPSNVLVTRSGRVVILDFGLVSELGRGLDGGMTHDGAPLGTPAYMAPEQAIAGTTSPASDYYAIGVMLFECLTGSLPFTGSAIEVMMHKQDGEIPDPRTRVADVPPALRELCMRLLDRNPEQRPGGRELLAELEQLAFGPSSVSSTGGSSSGSVGTGSYAALSMSAGSLVADGRFGAGGFVGRRRELALLSEALRDVEETGAAVTVHVHGAGGFGKSALLGRFLARARRKHDVLLLSGRCLERESVPYKGVDAIIDALSVQLRRMPALELAALQPRWLGPLTRIFPVLGDVWERPASPGTGDATEQRRLGLIALRELIVRLSARRPVLVSIDDFQWADVDSVRLLNTLMRPPDAPSMLVLLGYDEGVELRPGSRAALAELRDPAALAGRDVRALEVGALEQRDAIELTMKLLGDAAEPELARSYVARAGANPFYLMQMVLGAGFEGASELSLDEILARRIVDLDEDLRRLLAIVAAAGGPVSLDVLRELLDLAPPASLARAVEDLCVLGLLVRPRPEVRDDERDHERVVPGSAPARQSDSASAWAENSVEAANGRIRDVVLAELELAELRVLHLGLAEVLEQHGAELEAIAEHFVLADETERAAALTERAAEQAAAALAFARAVELYQRTLELLPATAPSTRRRALRLALAHQLINVGRGAAAADILLELAVVAQPEQARALRRRAAEQLLRAGRLDEGLDLSRTLFAELGEPMPRGLLGALALLLRSRLSVWLRPRGRLREAAEIPEQLLTRVDLVTSVVTGLSLQEIIVTQALHARALRLAREAGEPRRLGLVLSYEFVLQAAMGRKQRAHEMLVECRELAMRSDDRELERAIDLSEAMIDWFADRMPSARTRLAALLRRLEDSPGADWIRAYAAIRYAETCMLSGELDELRRESPRWIATARERGNLHEVASLHGLAATLHLYYDDLDAARRHLDAGRECWDSSRYTVPDMTLDLSGVNVRVYAGDDAGAQAELDTVASSVRGSGMHHIGMISQLIDRARTDCLARAAVRRRDDLGLRTALAQACARQLRRAAPPQRGEAWILEGTLRSLQGERDAARRAWRTAAILLAEHGQTAKLAAVHLRLASVTKGREAAEFEALGEAYLRSQAIPNRASFVDWVAPA